MNEPLNRLYDHLADYWQKIVDELVDSLYKVGKVASGKTVQSIGEFNPIPVEFSQGQFKINIYMPPYYQFLDEGVSGAEYNTGLSRFKYKQPFSYKNAPPISVIKKWMGTVRNAKWQVRNTVSGRNKQQKDQLTSLAFAISRKIWSEGLDKTDFYSNVINDEELDRFQSELLEYWNEYITDIVIKD